MLTNRLWRTMLVLVLLAISTTSPRITANQPGAAARAALTQVVVPVPVLTPVFTTLCQSYWYELPNAYQTSSAYLTQNVATVAQSSNSGVWSPNLSASGFYTVEVFIPAHPAIVWNCTTTKTIDTDTTAARYTVLAQTGVLTVTVDQAANAGNWVNLGSYYFAAGVHPALSLIDITSGPAFAKTVSFSAARFTQNPNGARLAIPLVTQGQPVSTNLSLDSLELLGRGAAVRTRFDAFEPVVYRLSGSNGDPTPVQAGLTYSLAGPCGSSVLNQGIASFGAGNWTQSLTTTIPACTGIYTATAQISGTLLSTSRVFQVDAGGSLRVFSDALFDMCNLPSIGDLATWWQSSPYSGLGAYLGGSAFASGCNFATAVTRTWVKDAQKQGWSFLPVWVGPQAPCSVYRSKFSAEPAVAYLQGRQEAQKAYSAAINLGFTEAMTLTTTIYYDVEQYPTGSPACDGAVGQFINGWTEELHTFKLNAGAYGLPSAANYGKWATLANTPDAVWMATYTEAAYSATVSVSPIPNLNDALWAFHQRIFQYAGGHNETWGGAKLNIDSNIADAPLLVSRWLTSTQADASGITVQSFDRAGDFQQVDANQGWVLADGRLQWTLDKGRTWQERSLPAALRGGLELAQAFFRSYKEGWILARSSTGFVLLHTLDGQAWELTTLPDTGAAQPFALAFDSAAHGRLAFRQPGLGAERQVTILETVNSGATWQDTSANLALRLDMPAKSLAGAAGGWTLNFGSGAAWNAFSGVPVPAELIGPKAMLLPEGADQVSLISATQAWAHTTIGQCSGVKGTPSFLCTLQAALWATEDGGVTWRLLVR